MPTDDADGERLYAAIDRMTARWRRANPEPPAPTAAEVYAEVDALLDIGPTAHRPLIRHADGHRRIDIDRLMRRMLANLPLGKQSDPTTDSGLEKVTLPTFAELERRTRAVSPGTKRRAKRAPRLPKPVWCRRCQRLRDTCIALGGCP